MARSNRNRLLVPGAENVVNQFKNEIANEFGVTLGRNTTAADNGSVGGEITKRLVAMGMQSRSNNNQANNQQK